MENEQIQTPKEETSVPKPSKKNTLISITLLQIVAVALAVVTAAGIKMYSGGFYKSASKIYHSATDAKTDIKEVISPHSAKKTETEITVRDKSDEPDKSDSKTDGGEKDREEDKSKAEEGGNGAAEQSQNTEQTSASDSGADCIDLNAVSVSSANHIIWPVSGKITSSFGGRTDPINGSADKHGGLDIAVNTGTPVKAAADGTIEKAEAGAFYGNYIIIKHSDSFSTVYGHLDKILKNVGDKVTKGETIALSGSTGRSTGPHLHFEIRIGGKKINPLSLLPANSQV